MHRRTFFKAGFFSLLASRFSFRGTAKAAQIDAAATSSGIDGQVITVNGAIDSANLGAVLTHEHLLINHPSGVLSSTSQAVTEVTKFKTASSSASTILGTSATTVISLSSRGLRWDNSGDSLPSGISSYPDGLRSISTSSGVQIVMGSSYYKSASFTHPSALDSMTIEQIEQEIIGDIHSGVSGSSSVRAGYIGEVGISRTSMSSAIDALEEKVLIASALAQARTGVGMSVHYDTSALDPDVKLSGLRLCAAAGADPQRIVLCHCSTYTISVADTVALASEGAFIGLDLLFDTAATASAVAARVSALKAKGILSQLLLSQDIYDASQYSSRSYDWVLSQVVPILQSTYSFSNTDIRTLLIDNPRRLLAIRAGSSANPSGTWFGGNSPQNQVGSGAATDLTSVSGRTSGTTACSFNGTSSELVIPHSPSFNAAHPFTVAFWMKASTQPGTYAAVVDKHHAYGDTGNLDVDYTARWLSGWVMQIYSAESNQLKFAVGTGSGFVIAATGVTVCDNAWHHVAGVYTGDAVEIYMDGLLMERQTINVTPLGNSRSLYIGRWGGGGRRYQGLLQDVNVGNGVNRGLMTMA
jgi:phosphotriesterase-related protein